MEHNKSGVRSTQGQHVTAWYEQTSGGPVNTKSEQDKAIRWEVGRLEGEVMRNACPERNVTGTIIEQSKGLFRYVERKICST